MAKVKPSNAWTVEDSDRMAGIVRCAEGDMDTWRRLAAQVVDWAGAEPDAPLEEPRWGWYRWIPDWTREHPKLLLDVDRPGRGVWRGAPVVFKAEAP